MAVLEVILFFYVLFSLCALFVENLPRIVAVILLLPVAPFLCGWEIRRERPFMAWTIIVLWGLLYAVFIIGLFIWATSH